MRILTSLSRWLRPRTEPSLRINGLDITQAHVDFIHHIKTARLYDYPQSVTHEIRFECQSHGFVAMFLRPWRWSVTARGEDLLKSWSDRLPRSETVTDAPPVDMMTSH